LLLLAIAVAGSLGQFLAKRFHKRVTYYSLIYLQFTSVFFILLSLAGIYCFRHFQIAMVLMHFIFSLLIVSIAFVTWAQFHITSVLKTGDINKVAAINYSAEMLGSATGAVLINAWIIQSFGLIVCLIVVACVSVMGIILMLVKKQV